MPCILAFDIGTKRTGVAFFDEATAIPLPLETITHTNEEDLITAVLRLVAVRKADRIIVGLPLLPSGAEGSQAQLVRSIVEKLAARGLQVECRDERYTTPRAPQGDPDAEAACNLLQTAISEQTKDD